MGVESSTKCLSLSVWKQSVCVCLESLFVQILVVKEFACLDITSCNKLNEKIYCLISFFADCFTYTGWHLHLPEPEHDASLQIQYYTNTNT